MYREYCKALVARLSKEVKGRVSAHINEETDTLEVIIYTNTDLVWRTQFAQITSKIISGVGTHEITYKICKLYMKDILKNFFK